MSSKTVGNIVDINEEIKKAMMNDNVPKFYGNGFSLALGSGDITILLKNGIKEVTITNLSFTTAKTLSIKLGNAISFLENQSKNTIMTTDEIEKSFSDKVGK